MFIPCPAPSGWDRVVVSVKGWFCASGAVVLVRAAHGGVSQPLAMAVLSWEHRHPFAFVARGPKVLTLICELTAVLSLCKLPSSRG